MFLLFYDYIFNEAFFLFVIQGGNMHSRMNLQMSNFSHFYIAKWKSLVIHNQVRFLLWDRCFQAQQALHTQCCLHLVLLQVFQEQVYSKVHYHSLRFLYKQYSQMAQGFVWKESQMCYMYLQLDCKIERCTKQLDFQLLILLCNILFHCNVYEKSKELKEHEWIRDLYYLLLRWELFRIQ